MTSRACEGLVRSRSEGRWVEAIDIPAATSSVTAVSYTSPGGSVPGFQNEMDVRENIALIE